MPCSWSANCKLSSSWRDSKPGLEGLCRSFSDLDALNYCLKLVSAGTWAKLRTCKLVSNAKQLSLLNLNWLLDSLFFALHSSFLHCIVQHKEVLLRASRKRSVHVERCDAYNIRMCPCFDTLPFRIK